MLVLDNNINKNEQDNKKIENNNNKYNNKENIKENKVNKFYKKKLKDNCYLIMNEQKKELCEYIELNNKEKDILKLKLIEIKPITDMSCMFSGCDSLTFLPDISIWDTKNVTNMSEMFNNCKSYFLPDISNWNVKNVTDMSYMFKNCSSLISLPDISKWEINKNLSKDSMLDGVNKKIIPKNVKTV